MLRAYDVSYNTLENEVQAPKLNIIDNESSKLLNQLLQKTITVLQLAPLYSHRRNAEERAICTPENHFIATLASINNNCPIYL